VSSILVLGFLLGMRHALEADHIAAVATLATRSRSARQAILQGVVWGLGHTVSLFLACSAALFLEAVVPERLARGLEGAVGAMLIVLGVDLLRRMWRDRIHFHAHRHGDGTLHVHVHSHAGDAGPRTMHAEGMHEHEHSRQFPARALYVGLMHGLAGSAALILLTLTTVGSPVTGLIYVGLFGLGSICGMAVLSAVISVPLRSARRFTFLYAGAQVAVGLTTMVIGSVLICENAYFLAT
jgi:ABC-type nickel/cobalt efflux system permease component RcnA